MQKLKKKKNILQRTGNLGAYFCCYYIYYFYMCLFLYILISIVIVTDYNCICFLDLCISI